MGRTPNVFRVEIMLKEIAVAELRPGMFAEKLNVNWTEHPFVRNKLLLDDDDISRIYEAGIKTVVIDTERGIDTDDVSVREVSVDTARQLEELAGESPVVADEALQKNNKEYATAAINYAVTAIRTLMDDVRMGHPLDLTALESVAEEVAREVVSNPATAVVVYHLHKTCEYTYAHCLRVAVLSVSCAHRMGLSDDVCKKIALGGLVHDIGKMCVNKEVLQKPDKLTPSEMDHMREHVTLGAGLIKEGQLSTETMAVLLEHHERFDGNGYPRQLMGNEISLVGRISAIADVYDAISSDRWYHKGLPPAVAIRKIHEWSKFHFDPTVTAHFIRSVGIYPVGSLVRLSSNRLAVVVEHKQSSPLFPRVLPVFDLRTKKIILKAIELDLSERRHIKIECYEDPLDWGISPGDYL